MQVNELKTVVNQRNGLTSISLNARSDFSSTKLVKKGNVLSEDSFEVALSNSLRISLARPRPLKVVVSSPYAF